MKMLHSDEFSCIQYLLGSVGKTIRIRGADVEYSNYFNVPKALDFLNQLFKAGLIEIKKSEVDFSGVFMDAFLRKYASLIKRGLIKEAVESADNMGLSALNDLLEPQKGLNETYKLVLKLLNQDDDLFDTEFSRDLDDAIYLTVHIKPKLRDYYEKYLGAFRKDELEKPAPKKEPLYPGEEYFRQTFYRYKHQRAILLKLLSEKLITQPPTKLRISPYKELPVEHLNFQELISCLEEEGLIIETKEEFELEGDNFSLSVNEDLILDEKTEVPRKTKLNLSFSSKAGFLNIDTGAEAFKIRIQGQVQKEVLRTIFANTENTYSEWSLYDISEVLGGSDVDTKSVKNALYQINKKVALEIPWVKKLFEITVHSAQINPIYKP